MNSKADFSYTVIELGYLKLTSESDDIVQLDIP